MLFYILLLSVLLLVDIVISIIQRDFSLKFFPKPGFNLLALLYLYFVFDNMYTLYLLDKYISYILFGYFFFSLFYLINYIKTTVIKREWRLYSRIYLLNLIGFITLQIITIY